MPDEERICKTTKEVSEAVKDNVDEFLIEGDLSKKVIRIKATGKTAWGLCAGSLAAAIALIAVGAAAIPAAPPAGAFSLAGGAVVSAVAASALGPAAVTAISIGVCAGGIGALNTLRDKYDIVEKGENFLKLKRKASKK